MEGNIFSDDYYTAFGVACLRNDICSVENFINSGILVNKYLNLKSEGGMDCTALHIAVGHQSLEIIRLLLKHGANIDAKNDTGQTPLHLAYYKQKRFFFSKNSNKIVDILLSHVRTDINSVDNLGLSHFHIACTRDRPDIVKRFLEKKADINGIIATDGSSSPLLSSGYTPLHFAIEGHQKRVIELLLKEGADITTQDIRGYTPFHFAFSCFYSENDFIDYILTNYVPKTKNPITRCGLSHFHIACTTKNIAAIKMFLDNGVNINDAVNFDCPKAPGYTPLHFAVEFNRKEVVEILLQHNASVDLREKEGFTSLHLACQQNARKICTILRNSLPIHQFYEEVTYEEAFKQCPYKALRLIAEQTEQVEIVDLLLQYKSNVNSQDNVGKTPMFYACDVDHDTFECKFGNSMTSSLESILNEFYIKRNNIIKVLLQYNPDLNIFDKKGETVLHSISHIDKIFGDCKKAEIAELLLNNGADVNARTRSGLTPLHIALRNGYQDLIETFSRYNANINFAEHEALHISPCWATSA